MSNLSAYEPDPAPNASRPIWELVIEDMAQRDATGREKYGTPLQAFNGRRALVDAYQEALDLVVYLRQEIEERKAVQAENDKLRMLLVYVAAPLRGDGTHSALCLNVENACEAGARLMRHGIPVIVPHLSAFLGMRSGPIYRHYVPEYQPYGFTVDAWYAVSVLLVSRCDAVLRLPGESTGADLEVARAAELGKPVFHDVGSVIAWANKQEGRP